MGRATKILILVLLLAAGSVYGWLKSQQTPEPGEPPSGGLASRPTPLSSSGRRSGWHEEYRTAVADAEQMVDFALKDSETTPESAASLKKTLEMVRTNRARTLTRAQMHDLMLAFKTYQAAYQRLGPDPSGRPANFDADGRPFVSWRVHLLPFLGETALYEKFRLDEPYDSPNNKPLIEEMPDCFRLVTEKEGATRTRFLAMDGPGSLFEGGRFRSLKDVADPVSETMLVAVVAPENGVVWSKPEDLVIDPADPLKGFQPIGPDGFMFLTAEGSALTFVHAGTPEQFLALLTYRGGDPPGIIEAMTREQIRRSQEPE